MKESLKDVVRDAVARHLDVEVSEIDPEVNLVHELHLDPLDLVLIALRLEEMECREFPIHRLEFVQTVSELVEVVEEMRATPPLRTAHGTSARSDRPRRPLHSGYVRRVRRAQDLPAVAQRRSS